MTTSSSTDPNDSRDSNAASPVVVVPDGLAASGSPRRALAEPSFAFRAVLDHVAGRYGSHRIWVAPANTFGGPRYEQEVAADYLRGRGVADVVAPPSPRGGYIDTRGNARLLREHLEGIGAWPLGQTILAVVAPHARRAYLCFTNEGFEVVRLDAIPFTIPRDERVVPELWYYAYPFAHRVYEALALVRERARISARRPPP